MTDTRTPIAAWYPDPARDGQLRWWDGAAWTTQVREAAPLPAVAAEPIVTVPELRAPAAWTPEPTTVERAWSQEPTWSPTSTQDWRPAEPALDPLRSGYADQTRAARGNPVAMGALIIGLVNVGLFVLALFMNVDPYLRMGAAAIGVIASIVAVRQAQRIESGLMTPFLALVGNLIIGVVAVVSFVQVTSAAGAELGDELSGQLDDLTGFRAIVEAGIQEQAALDQQLAVSDVTCPDDMSRIAGATYTCTETLADGSTHSLLVTVTDTQGAFTYEVKD